ncbi:MAG TPA: PEP-CTERM sorting domain-containing protein [Gemmatimonadales bacterium]|nr:PEP-CTERM sorting domain-containing protein [Gemmatimonadales bacterium]
MNRLARFTRILAAASVLFAAPANAQLPVDGGWQQFFWSSVGATESPFDSFVFNPPTVVKITVTDAFVVGDQFRLSWTGTTSGFFDTSVPIDDDSDIGADADGALANPDWSSGWAIFGPGSYNFTLETILTATCCSGGGAFIRADTEQIGSTVPEPATMTLLATGLAAMAASRRRAKA